MKLEDSQRNRRNNCRNSYQFAILKISRRKQAMINKNLELVAKTDSKMMSKKIKNDRSRMPKNDHSLTNYDDIVTRLLHSFQSPLSIKWSS